MTTPKVSRRCAQSAAILLILATVYAPARAQTPVVDETEPLTLSEVYRLAEQRNARLAAARSFAVAVEARAQGASTLPDPALQVGFMNLKLPSLSADMPSSMAPALQLMQMVPFPGKLGVAGRVADESTRMAEADAAEAWWQVRADAAIAFYALYEADRQLTVMHETMGLLEDFGQVAEAMYSAGMGRQSDVLRANVEVARMDADIRRMEAMRKSALARLNAVLNRPAGTNVSAAQFGPLPLEMPAPDTLLRWADETRPLLERGRLRVRQATAQQDLARKEIWPDLMVGVQYGQRRGEMGTQHMGGVMLGFTLPVFASRRQFRMRDEAFAMQQMADAHLVELRAEVDSRVSQLLADLERDRELVRLYRSDVLPQAEANVESAFSSYRVGAVDFMTLVDARMTVNRYEQELYAMLADYGRTIAALEMTIGRELPGSPSTLLEER